MEKSWKIGKNLKVMEQSKFWRVNKGTNFKFFQSFEKIILQFKSFALPMPSAIDSGNV